jgi:hypothetical protein
MKNYMIIGAVWVLGLMVGSVWHRSELALSKAEIARLNTELASKTKKSLIPDMARMMAVPETRPQRAYSTPVIQDSPNGNTSDSDNSTATDTVDTHDDDFGQNEFARQMAETFEGSESPEEAFQIMSDLWRTRRELARAALVDNQGLSPSEIRAFDAAIDDMNDELADRFEDIAARFEEMSSEPSPEEAFRMVNDFSGVFVGAYDTMDDTLPPGWRDDEKPLDLTAFIDPSVFQPMMDAGMGRP